MTTPINLDEINAIVWKACDTFRGIIDRSEYKNYILVMLFFKYVSGVWFDHSEQLERELHDPENIEQRLVQESFISPKGTDFYSLYEQRNTPNLGEQINVERLRHFDLPQTLFPDSPSRRCTSLAPISRGTSKPRRLLTRV